MRGKYYLHIFFHILHGFTVGQAIGPLWDFCAPISIIVGLIPVIPYPQNITGSSSTIYCSGAGRWKTLRGPVVIGGDNLPSPVRIGLTVLQNIGGPVAPQAPPVPAPLIVEHKTQLLYLLTTIRFLKCYINKQVRLPYWGIHYF